VAAGGALALAAALVIARSIPPLRVDVRARIVALDDPASRG
jgi:hypothetical protein